MVAGRARFKRISRLAAALTHPGAPAEANYTAIGERILEGLLDREVSSGRVRDLRHWLEWVAAHLRRVAASEPASLATSIYAANALWAHAQRLLKGWPGHPRDVRLLAAKWSHVPGDAWVWLGQHRMAAARYAEAAASYAACGETLSSAECALNHAISDM